MSKYKKMLKPTASRPYTNADFLKSGVTLLDLACGNVHGAFIKGHYYLLVGASNSGKTYLAHAILAEAACNPHFADYALIYDDVESGALFDKEAHFGSRLAKRIESPEVGPDGLPASSNTVEGFYYNVDDAMTRGPCVYILDSMDSLDSETALKRFDDLKQAHRKGKEKTAGTFGVEKAKANSTELRKVLSRVHTSKSILIIISQTRDNIGFGFEKNTRSGGRALRFYATLEIWLSAVSKIAATVRGKKRQIGIKAKAQVKKNRINGRDRTLEFDIYHSAGIDDVGANIDYLISEKHWKVARGVIDADELEVNLSRSDLIEYIENSNLEDDLAELTAKLWRRIERECAVKRKPKYE